MGPCVGVGQHGEELCQVDGSLINYSALGITRRRAKQSTTNTCDRTDDNSDECDQAFTEMAQEAGDTLVQMPSAAFIAENPEKRAAAKLR